MAPVTRLSFEDVEYLCNVMSDRDLVLFIKKTTSDALCIAEHLWLEASLCPVRNRVLKKKARDLLVWSKTMTKVLRARHEQAPVAGVVTKKSGGGFQRLSKLW